MSHRPNSTSGETDGEDRQFVAALRTALATATAADTIGNPTPPDQLLEMIVRAAARAIPSPEGALMLVDTGRNVLTFDVVIGSTAATVRDVTVPVGHGIAGLVAASGQALAIANAQNDPRHARDVAEQSGYLPTTILAVPVMGVDGTPIGVLELLDRRRQPTFDLNDMELLGMFADQIALVIGMRRSHDLLAARLGTALASLGGLSSEAQQTLAVRTEPFAARVEADEASRRTDVLADLVASIADQGSAEYEACMAVLKAFSQYSRATPTLGMGMFE